MTIPAEERNRDEQALQAWYDGEIGPLARWRFARRLARSEELQRDLRMLEAVGESVRDSEASVAAPELWGEISRQLPGIDGQRAQAQWEGRRRGSASWLWKPVSALAGAAAVAVLAIGLLSGDTAPRGVVHWVDGLGANVMVLDGERDVTVIWVFDSLTEDAARGGIRAAV